MGQGLVIWGRRVRFRFILFIGAIAVTSFWISNLTIKQNSFGTVEHGTVTTWSSGDGLIIRDEEVFDADAYGRIDYFSADGEIVEKNDLLAVLYKNNYNKSLVENLYQVKKKISDYQDKNIIQDILDNDYSKLESDINGVVYNIQLSTLNDSMSSLEYQEKQLRTLLLRRQDLISKKVTPDQYLQQLYKEEAELNKQLNEWKIDIVAPDAGIVSFRIDGLERILNSGSIDYMTTEEFLNIQQSLAKQDEDDISKVDKPLFKLIDPQKWYLVCHISSPDVLYEKNDVLNVKLLGTTQKVLEGIVYKVDHGDNSTLITLEFSEGIESIIHKRSLPVEIGKTTEGLLVPSSSIIKKHGKTGVEFIYKGKTRYMDVKVKAIGEGKAVIEKIGDVDGLNLHDKVIIP